LERGWDCAERARTRAGEKVTVEGLWEAGEEGTWLRKSGLSLETHSDSAEWVGESATSVGSDGGSAT
jgi:hypothetical protein